VSQEKEYLTVPPRRLIDITDYFTRMDEELAVIIKGLNMLLYRLDLLLEVVERIGERIAPPEVAPPPPEVPPPPTPPIPPPTPPTIPQVTISLPYRVKLRRTMSVTLQSTKEVKEIMLFNDVFLLLADEDIYIAETSGADGVRWPAGYCMVVNRSAEFDRIYIRPVEAVPVKVYFMFFDVGEK